MTVRPAAGRGAGARLALPLVVLALAACLPERDAGYVELKVSPGFSSPLYLNATRIDPPRNDSAVLRQEVGRARLEMENNGKYSLLCEFFVRKNRITTVTVSPFERGPRCAVRM